MATRHKQQLVNYLSRHKNGIAHAGTKEASVSRSVQSRNKTSIQQTSASSSPSRANQPNVLRSRTTQVKHKNTVIEGCLPDEVLLKIFSYLDVVSLLQASQVCKRWCDVSHDDSLWKGIAQKYATKEKTKKDGAADAKPTDRSPSFHTQWKNVCIARCASWRNERMLKLVKKTRLNPFTGLPRDTETALKESGITYQLSLVDGYGKESFSESSKVTLHRSSAAVVWHSLTFLRLQQVRRLRILAVLPLFYNDRGAVVRGSPYQRSLLWEADVRLSEWTTEKHMLAMDDQITLYQLPGDLLLATWKADGEIAFFAAGLHYNHLVQRCLQGTPTQCYQIPPHKIIADDIDKTYGLHDYKATVELRTLHQSIWSQQFSGLHCSSPGLPCGTVGFTLIRHDAVVDHTPLEKRLCLPWRTELFKGTMENTAWLDVTVLDERGEVFFTASSPIRACKPSVQGSDFEYEECDHLLMVYQGERATVQMQIGKLTHGKAFVRHLELLVKNSAINEWFGTSYPVPDIKKSGSSSSGRK